ncbi:LysR family transcriptional regulator [Bosea sp. UC22_33]|uniref:LysR family transcriptional regulator n=1 Tax=Bosea sp. UC22_33 TaxID=3350165 RepID=UPI00366FE87A
MNLTLRQLEILVAIGDTLSLTGAAEKLGVSQPSVSETLRRVEAELGCRLVDRTTRQLALTYEGQHVVASAREAMRSLAGTFEAIARRGDGVHGRLSIAALPSAVCTLLPPVLRAFRDRYPGIAVAVRDALQDRAMAMLQEGSVDLVIAGRPDGQGAFVFEEIANDRLTLVVSRRHPLSGRGSVDWSDLAACEFIAMSPSSSVRRLTDAGFIHANLPVAPAYEVDQISCAAALAAAGLGVTALPTMTFAMFRADELAMIPLVAPTIERSIGMAWLKDRPLSASAIKFAAVLRSASA